MNDWDLLGTSSPEALADARLALHAAIQVASAPGKLLLRPRADQSQQSLAWEPRQHVLAQSAIDAAVPFRSALRLAPPALLLLTAIGEPTARLPLEGRTLGDAWRWLDREVESLFGRALPEPFERPAEMPDHPFAAGAPWATPDPAPFAELAGLFAGTDVLLREVAEAEPGASPVRCWPHHFDLATLIALDPEGDPETARSIGVGLSPGDGSRPLPYFYVTPWPYPAQPELPELAGGGSWNREEWLGAVLEHPQIVATATGEARQEQVRAFLASAVAACRRLLERPAS
jgi:hypothetical protein